jgi:hypothetical protein
MALRNLQLRDHNKQLKEYNKQLTEYRDYLVKSLYDNKKVTAKEPKEPVLSDRVFPLTMDGGDPKYAFKQVWQDLRTRAKIPEIDGEMLEFRDLRKAAMRRFEEAELTDTEQSMQMGHAFPGMKEVYLDKHARAIKLKRIRDKLDRLTLGGMTLEERLEKINNEGTADQIRRTGMAAYIKYLEENGEIGIWDKILIPQSWRNMLTVVEAE